MNIKIVILVFCSSFINIIYTTEIEANKILESLCDILPSNNSLQYRKNQKRDTIIEQESSRSKVDDQYIVEEQHESNNVHQINSILRRAIRLSGSSIRNVRGIRGSSSHNGGANRPTTSVIRYRNTRTGTSISRPNGWLWSRSRLVFLPLATLYFHRSRSASNRYTTQPSTSLTYYYCTSNDGSVEIQCSSMYGDTLCCEDQTSQQPFCCGGDIPDDFVEDPNGATRRLTKIFYTLTAITLCMHLLRRHFCQ
ncbi:unnamed protein product [Rotaria magnacalcarata]|uniref:Uncharacterized protein n=1 Tax=Rotaria magnacalcarata TaxID=392030 RepID=A0A816L4D3_9BILA|nr:unnamed protein product [Rotaria magnacalcarata]CAF5140529.1 unnamed protein product [Rotaria magnacalcarata]